MHLNIVKNNLFDEWFDGTQRCMVQEDQFHDNFILHIIYTYRFLYFYNMS